ncbi:MAG: bifunctional hydroxymethylpyrimidine kinase/phosphomethylpyrimidine kinase [Anaerolineaceae bacterium]|nr:bifunctional hydroxymethylpyrimidine kinase/phosphomethylpyrimidine kinase [Anaerolineaceae bacterium]
MTEPLKAIVIGALNIDLVIQGLPHFAQPGEQVNGQSVRLSPGGKGRNIAAMLAPWLPPGQVGMISKLVQDARGLYKIPLDSLESAGISLEGIQLETDRPDELPTLSIFLNQTNGQRASYYLPGRNETLTSAEIAQARPLLENLAANDGILLMTLELPLETAAFTLALAHELALPVMLDPGGQPPEAQIDFAPLFIHPPKWIKPNADEAERITGARVQGFEDAKLAARKLLENGVECVLITDGAKGAYGFTAESAFHLTPPERPIPPHAESTGCGDQVLAVLCAQTLAGKAFRPAAELAIQAGTLQFVQAGMLPIQPDHPHLKI